MTNREQVWLAAYCAVIGRDGMSVTDDCGSAVSAADIAADTFCRKFGDHTNTASDVLAGRVRELEESLARVNRLRETAANHHQDTINRIGDVAYNMMAALQRGTKTLDDKQRIIDGLVGLGMCRRCWGMGCASDRCQEQEAE